MFLGTKRLRNIMYVIDMGGKTMTINGRKLIPIDIWSGWHIYTRHVFVKVEMDCHAILDPAKERSNQITFIAKYIRIDKISLQKVICFCKSDPVSQINWDAVNLGTLILNIP